MKSIIYPILFCLSSLAAQDQLYFPPNNSDEWEKQSIEDVGWCEEATAALFDMLEENDTKAFLALKDGKIVIEKYFDGFHQDSSWVWFSAGKSLTAFLVGLAQEQGDLNIDDSSQNYLGTGWSSLNDEQEREITVRHHLTMTTGLDYTVDDPFCTDPECLEYLNEPGDHWYYHNAPYSLVRRILQDATSRDINIYTFLQMHSQIGMDGLWIPVGFNNFFFSTPRSMARFGLLMLANGDWNGETIMGDKDYFQQMISPSQDLNKAYGYLWWLNGQESFKVPSSDIVFQGMIDEAAPADMYAAVGALGQILYIVPSENLILIRMGGFESDALVPIDLIGEISRHMKDIKCSPSSSIEQTQSNFAKVYPNPLFASDLNLIHKSGRLFTYEILDVQGKLVTKGNGLGNVTLDFQSDAGIYYVKLKDDMGSTQFVKLIKN